MHKRAFQGLKRTFMQVIGLPTPFFDNKTNLKSNLFFKSKSGGGRPGTCINVRFRPRNALLCMSQVFPHHILINKKIDKMIIFLTKIWWGKTCYLKKPHHILIIKTNYFISCYFFNSKHGRGRPETCINKRFRA